MFMLETIVGSVLAAVTAVLISMWQVKKERLNAIEHERMVFFEQQKIQDLADAIKECDRLIFVLDDYRSFVENEIRGHNKLNNMEIDAKVIEITKKYLDSFFVIKTTSTWYCYENIKYLQKVEESINSLLLNRYKDFSFTEGSYLDTQERIHEIKKLLIKTQVSFISKTIPKELLDPEIILEENKKK